MLEKSTWSFLYFNQISIDYFCHYSYRHFHYHYCVFIFNIFIFSFSSLLSFYFILCSSHVMFVFRSESSLSGCLNVKELIDQNWNEVWNFLSDCNWIRTHNHLIRYELSGCRLESSCILFYLCIYQMFSNYKQIKRLNIVGNNDTEAVPVSLMGT